MYEIAKGYNVNWEPEGPIDPLPEEPAESAIPEKDNAKGKGKDGSDDGNGDGDEGEDEDGDGDGGEGVGKETTRSTSDDKAVEEKAVLLMKKNEAKGDLPKYPAGQERDAWAGTGTVIGAEGKKGSEEEELAKRFERLKNLR